MRCIFYCVSGQIEQDLTEASRIRAPDAEYSVFYGDLEIKAFVVSVRPKNFPNLFDENRDVHRLEMNFCPVHLGGSDLQHAVQHCEQHLTARTNTLKPFALRIVQVAIHEQSADAQDGVDGGTDVVTNCCQHA